jgi:hypothetical protein
MAHLDQWWIRREAATRGFVAGGSARNLRSRLHSSETLPLTSELPGIGCADEMVDGNCGKMGKGDKIGKL